MDERILDHFHISRVLDDMQDQNTFVNISENDDRKSSTNIFHTCPWLNQWKFEVYDRFKLRQSPGSNPGLIDWQFGRPVHYQLA